ncbi:MAG: ATP-binding cassette domain-containing protein [Kiritimatiellae bacterium]|nr:ATP-binding cassette domain-containing protein [Kiritimatiellia bacterium]
MLLNVDNLHVVYHKRGQAPVAAVRGVSFRIEAGASFGIVGESGCGKSSLAKTLIGLQKPAGGKITFEGAGTASMTAAEFRRYRRSVQMVFQDAVGSLNPRMTVRQTLEEVLRVHCLAAGTGIKVRVEELMDLVGLPHNLLDAFPREISGGQCQRVSIARCLALEPRLIIADEPVSALDVSVQARILNLLRSLQRDLNLAIILISHDLAVVRNICDKVAVMSEGVFVETGSADEVIKTPRHEYTRSLLEAVPDVGRALKQKPRMNTD